MIIRVSELIRSISPSDRKITLVNTGHPPPLLGTGEIVRQLTFDSGLPLGIQENDYSECVFEIPGDSQLLLYSDGLSEAMNPSEEMYTEERIINLMQDPLNP